MTKTLTIELNQDYKSFNKDEKIPPLIATNNLIIISGKNGSGKSHLAEIIMRGSIPLPNQESKKEDEKEYSSIVKIDDDYVYTNNLTLRTLKDAFVGNNNLDVEGKTLDIFGMLSENMLEDKYDFNHETLTELNKGHISDIITRRKLKQICRCINNNNNLNFKVIKSNFEEFEKFLINNNIHIKDTFQSNIEEIFTNFFEERLEERENKKDFDEETFIKKFGYGTENKLKPWEYINQIFEKIKFDYRFSEPNYKKGKLINFNLKHQLLNNEILDLTENFQDKIKNILSTGEQAIISLLFALMNNSELKILILDEYEAVLNPSLIETFYSILEKYFIDRGILVIIICP